MLHFRAEGHIARTAQSHVHREGKDNRNASDRGVAHLEGCLSSFVIEKMFWWQVKLKTKTAKLLMVDSKLLKLERIEGGRGEGRLGNYAD